ncbi:MAG: PIN domain-containing protein [Methanomicrobiaceae archaeon]|uniref:Toxin 1, pin domain n=1 Tax=hydrocarbon metagenome TaxID=938273 RepID=A0A0W8FKH5_9ZZZZ|nr:PIN domain-containing protein [Methanomicrobiaceae archaeon]MDD5418494.1 PIN domain-containing protein [Methanomicrobiaceae archaeon]
MTGNPPLIDTNILVSLFDADAPEKRRVSKDLVAACWRSETRYSVSVQNLAEFSVVVTEKVEHPMPAEDVQRFVRNIRDFEGWNVVGYGSGTILHALEIRERYHVHFRDALLAATMIESGIGTIITEDAHLLRIPGITVTNPYRHG